jgi:hypothetical protein
MRPRSQLLWCATLLTLALPVAPAVAAEAVDDLRRAVPADAYLFVHARHNPEREYQRAYFEDVWNTAVETRIIERFLEIVTSRIDEEHLAAAERVLDEVRTAAEPID